jgi:hypothetical protein
MQTAKPLVRPSGDADKPTPKQLHSNRDLGSRREWLAGIVRSRSRISRTRQEEDRISFPGKGGANLLVGRTARSNNRPVRGQITTLFGVFTITISSMAGYVRFREPEGRRFVDVHIHNVDIRPSVAGL